MSPLQYRKELAAILPEGWTIEIRRCGHLALVAPHGGKVFCAASASDHRAIKNIQRDVRRVAASAH
jgi:hypothetical protein